MKPVAIVGGGLAGLTLGISLRHRNVPVTVFEAGRYPRHRVCGEFISGRGRAVLSGFDLEKKILAAGAFEAKTASFFSGRVTGRSRALPRPALNVSRFVLDELLAHEFQRLGGDLCQAQRWREPFGEGIVRATGRRTSPTDCGWRWFGLKVHARNVALDSDLEMHLTPSGYVGLARLPAGEVNICGLFRSQAPVSDLSKTWRNWLAGPGDSGLRARLAKAEFLDDSFCSVAGLQPFPQPRSEPAECCVGDSLTMVPPLTGNGMSIAFESAALVSEPVLAYSRGELSWLETCQESAVRCGQSFSRRMKWGGLLQKALLQPRAGDALVWLGSRCAILWNGLFDRTR